MPGSSASSTISTTASSRSHMRRLPIGAEPIGSGRTHVRVWAPAANRVEVVVSGVDTPLQKEPGGYFGGVVKASAGMRYQLRLDTADRLLPDPASRFQPEGPHGPS